MSRTINSQVAFSAAWVRSLVPALLLALASAASPTAAQASTPLLAKPAVKPAAQPGCSPLDPLDEVDDDDAEAACLAVIAPLAKRDGAALMLKLANGTTKTFTNEGGKPASNKDNKLVTSWTKSALLIAYDPLALVFLLKVQGGIVAVDARDGRETNYNVDIPHYAPGGVFALTISRETGTATIRDTAAKPAKVVWESVPKQHLNRSFVAWDGDRRVRLLVEDKSTAFVVRDPAGKWTYDMVAMDEPIVEAPSSCMPEPSARNWVTSGCVAKLGGAVIDNGTLLSLRLEDGSRKRLLGDDTEDYSKYQHYSLVGFDAAAHAYVVHTQYYEGFSTMVVDSRTGAEIELGDGADIPWFSPDRSRFLVTASGDEENNPSGTDVRMFSWGTKPAEVWSSGVSEKPYAIARVTGWDGDRRIGLQLADGRKATVVLDDDRHWRLESPAASAAVHVDKP